MSDEMIQLLAKNGGVIHINFGTDFLDGRLRNSRDSLRTLLNSLLIENDLKRFDEDGKSLIDSFKLIHQNELFSDVQMVVDHIDHVTQLVGIDHVGFGSDFDGVGDSLPTGLKDVSKYPNLILELLKRGYSDKDIAKICYQNTFRVWKIVRGICPNSTLRVGNWMEYQYDFNKYQKLLEGYY